MNGLIGLILCALLKNPRVSVSDGIGGTDDKSEN